MYYVLGIRYYVLLSLSLLLFSFLGGGAAAAPEKTARAAEGLRGEPWKAGRRAKAVTAAVFLASVLYMGIRLQLHQLQLQKNPRISKQPLSFTPSSNV